ncbi:MAG: hypothetical protein ABIZ80_26155, partial [Bryobacteraceae bacterium]
MRLIQTSKRCLSLGGGILALALTAWGGTIGNVVPIGGQPSDIALDESRGVLYIANYAGNSIEVMNLADRSIQRSINVGPLPISISLSPDSRLLLVAHYANFRPPATPTNILTLINLSNNTRQTFATTAPPLAVAFGGDGRAIVATTAGISLFDPATGISESLVSSKDLAGKVLPVTPPSAPVQVTESAIGASRDGRRIYGSLGDIGFYYDVPTGTIEGFRTGAVPPHAPRTLSVSDDGSYFAYGWTTWDSRGRFRNNFTNVTGKLEQGTYAVDSVAGIIYAQVPEAVQAGPASPVLQVLDADNLTVRESLLLPEGLAGRSVLNAARDVLYSVSES